MLPGPEHEIIMSLLKLLTDRRKQTVNVVKKKLIEYYDDIER